MTKILMDLCLEEDLPEPITAVGINGEVEGIAHCLVTAGVETSYDDVMGVTATALRTHFFRPRDNPGMPIGPVEGEPHKLWAPRYAWTSLRHNNYGQCESAAFYYGGEVRPVDDLNAVDTWRLIRYELDAGHPVVAYGLTEGLVPTLIVGYRLEKGPLRQILYVLTAAGRVDVDVTGLKRESEGRFPRELLLVRPGPCVHWRGTDETRRLDALRWAYSHARNGRELVYESSRFYATGPAAFDAFAEFLRDLLPAELDAPISSTVEEAPVQLALFCRAIIESWASARGAAQAYFNQWSDRLRSEDRNLEGLEAGAQSLVDLADSHGRCLATLEGLLSELPSAPGPAGASICDGALRERLALGIEEARAQELKSVQSLGRLLGL